ncbi:polysaccharide pyruvyl transferase family protein [Candidatus Woesearchaeota archaeon CG_4_10_14_0_2_um_filter_33_13]|nr:MAG: polysaccharide pyruvyl transferase family protein [Candidatus Woesearchaeota archaeon CG_4_10_14_0_2_um_filter_33_13]
MSNKLKAHLPVFWHKSINYGDQLMPYLVEKITNTPCIYVDPEEKITKLVGIGSILGADCTNSIIWGTGFAWHKEYKHEPITNPLQINMVRGKLTQEKFHFHNIDCPSVYGDPALILPLLYNPPTNKTYQLGIIPHIIDLEKAKQQFTTEELEKNNAAIIDLTKPVEEVTRAIMSCHQTISSSLHGVVVSHAYQIPCLWVEFSYNVIGQGFKFKDYFSSVDINPYNAFNLVEKQESINNIIKNIPSEIPKNIDFKYILDAFPK